MRRHESTLARSLLTAALASLALSGALLAAAPPAARGLEGMVVSPEAHATQVGLRVLRDGGNAIDATVAVSFALAVTYPRAGNIGGGGFLLYRTSEGAFRALDHRETAPAALGPELFLDDDGQPDPSRSRSGGLAIGVPGSVAGLAEAHRRWGSLPWPDLVAPAIRLAEEGVPVTRRTVAYMSRVSPVTGLDANARLAADPEARAIFTVDGAPMPEGHLLVQKDLASTLRRIAKKGPAGFYEGPVARAIVETVTGYGGVLTLDDLKGYRPVDREPVQGTYRGYRVVSFPPPSSGGVALLQILGMLERYDVAASGPGSSLTLHRLVESMRRAYADRARWLGDPDHFEVPLASLLSADYLASRTATIADERATPSSKIAPWAAPPPEPPSTLHFSVADPSGNTVAMTTTLNSSFGAAIVARGTGLLLNNEIDDFAIAPGVPNQFGLVGGEANAIRGGKRPLSSMTPTIVDRAGDGGRPVLVVGSPGGGTIITAVLQVVLNVLDHEMPLQEAVNAPRVHHQWLPDLLQYEARGLSRDVIDALARRGHTMKQREFPLGMIAAIGLDDDGAWLGAADPRGEGTAAGF